MKYVPFYNELKTDRDDCYFIGFNSADGFRCSAKTSFNGYT